MKMSAVIDFIK